MKLKIISAVTMLVVLSTASISLAVTSISGASITLTATNAAGVAQTATYSASKSVTVKALSDSTTAKYTVTAGHSGGLNKPKGLQYGTTDSDPAVRFACSGTATHPADPATAGTAATVGTCNTASGTVGSTTWQ